MNKEDQLAIDTVRTLAMDAVQAADSGHPGTPMALAPLGWTIFSRLRKHDPAQPEWPDRDRFVLSCGHASMLQYALLHLSGYALSLDEIKRFRQWDSKTPGHPEVHHTPGVETTTGPLGQGFANAVGMAMAEKHLAARFNRKGHELFDHYTFVIASDGDLMEGVSAEAASLAGHLKLGKIIAYWDDNSITIDGRTDLSFSEDVVKRYEAYGWHTQSVMDGNDVAAIEKATEAAKKDPRPSFIRVKTIIGFPSPKKQNTSSAHGSPLGEDEIVATKKVLGVPETKFFVPSELAAQTSAIRERGAKAHAEWEKKLSAYRSAFPEDAKTLEQTLKGELPAGWDADLPKFAPNAKGEATRKSGGAVLAAIADKVPSLVGGSADLAGSNLTNMKGKRDFQAEGEGAPRNIHFGIREHAMASICNGMALHGGVRPFGATFLVFSDYMKPAIRLAAIMNLPVLYVLTHDSIGLGEDGPTHQPVEHLAALRAIPGMTVLRPGDANEVREAWRVAMEQRGPVAMVLTRQNVATLDRSAMGSEKGVEKGAYVLSDCEGLPKVVFMATGSEVSIALSAQAELKKEGVASRVVSMPSWELFERTDAKYQESVLPSAVTARVAIEAATRFGWERWVGSKGAYVTLDRFGASAPAETLYEKLGITAAKAVEAAKRLL